MTPSVCADKLTVTLPDDIKDYVVWSESEQKFTFPEITDDVSLVGTYPIKVTYEVLDADGNVVKTEEIDFNLDIKSPCDSLDKSTLTPGLQPTETQSDNFSNTLIEHVWVPYTISPSFCDVVVSCKDVIRQDFATNSDPFVLDCQELSNDNTVGEPDQTLSWQVGETEYMSKDVTPGVYIYRYEVRVGGPSGAVRDTFEIPVWFKDPCNPPNIVQPAAGTIEYTVTDQNQAKLELTPEYSVDPSWCPFELDLKKPGEPKIDSNLNLDKQTQDVTLDPILNDLGPAGADQTSYDACTTITTQNFDGTPNEQEVCHEIIVKNPCINPDYVTISLPKPLPGGEYVVETGPLSFAPVAADQQDLVNALPVDHDLCGAITCVDLYQGSPNDDSVISWNQGTLVWTVDTNDRTLIGKSRTFSLVCEFASYPTATYNTATSDQAGGTVNFKDPCVEDFSVTATNQ